MPRRLNAGHYALAGLLVVSLLGGWLTSGRFPAEPQEADQQASFGSPAYDGGSWKYVDGDDHVMEVEGWGDALFVWALRKAQDEDVPDQDLWILEQQASVAPVVRDHRPDPVVGLLRMRAYPTEKTALVFQDWMDVSVEGVDRDVLTLDARVPGETELLLDEGRFGGAAGERFARYSAMFLVEEGSRPRFRLEREIAFRSAFGTRSCASAEKVLDTSAGVSPECVVEGGR